MENKQFIDISNLTSEDWKEIERIMYEKEIEFHKALPIFMKANVGKARVVGELKDGKFVRDEISMSGIKEFKGDEAFDRMINDIKTNKENK